MKMIQNKKLIQKILILLFVVVSFNFICPTIANAASDDGGNLGGVLIGGVCDLLTALGDGVMNIIHKFVVGQEDTLIHVTENGWIIAGKILAAIVVAAVAIALTAAGLGAINAAIGALVAKFAAAATIIHTISTASIVLVSAAAGVSAGVILYNHMEQDISLPVYTITPEEIFYGKIPLFNVNFFNPDTNIAIYNDTFTKSQDVTGVNLANLIDVIPDYKIQLGEVLSAGYSETAESKHAINYYTTFKGEQYRIEIETKYKTTERFREEAYYDTQHWEEKWHTIYKFNNSTKEYEMFYRISPETAWFWDEQEKEQGYRTADALIESQEWKYLYIPQGSWQESLKKLLATKFGLYIEKDYFDEYSYLEENAQLDGNTCTFESENEDYKYKLVIENYRTTDEKRTLYTTWKYTNSAADLQPIVAQWYVTLRNIALVMSMSILVYVGIRMMLTSVAAEKAKYKTILFDWVIGIGLMFVMQYIMVFMTALNDEFINLISNATDTYVSTTMFKLNTNWDGEKTTELNEETGTYENFITFENNGEKIKCMIKVLNGQEYISYPTNLMGEVRLGIQNGRNQTLTYVGMTIVFLVLVFYTAFFVFTYIKRVIYMAFLTIIAPFVAMTYPLDKISDGKAQAFNMWLKEYIFNLLIQPMHLLLYYILISSALQLSKENIIYTLVAIGFLIPAEKLIRKFFGFDKAQTPGFLGGAAGAGLVMSAVGNLRRFASSGKGGHKDGAEKDTTGKNRTKDSGASLDTTKMFNASNNSASDESKTDIKTNSNSQDEKEVETSSVSKSTRTVDEQTMVASTVSEKAFPEERKAAQSNANAEGGNNTPGENNKPGENSAKGSNSTSSGDSKRTLGARIKGASGAVLGSAGRGVMKVASKAPGLIARGYGAATLGAIGLAAGIATGDANNALQYTLTGGAAGSAVGAGLYNRATNALGNAQDDWVRGWYGDEYDEYLNKKSDRQFMLSKENRNFYKSEFGDDWHSKMEEAKKYRQHKVTDNVIIAKAMKKLDGYSEQEKIYLAKLASKINTQEDWARRRESLERQTDKHGNKIWPEARLEMIEEGINKLKFNP